jgi:hypothetical protein
MSDVKQRPIADAVNANDWVVVQGDAAGFGDEKRVKVSDILSNIDLGNKNLEFKARVSPDGSRVLLTYPYPVKTTSGTMTGWKVWVNGRPNEITSVIGTSELILTVPISSELDKIQITYDNESGNVVREIDAVNTDTFIQPSANKHWKLKPIGWQNFIIWDKDDSYYYACRSGSGVNRLYRIPTSLDITSRTVFDSIGINDHLIDFFSLYNMQVIGCHVGLNPGDVFAIVHNNNIGGVAAADMRGQVWRSSDYGTTWNMVLRLGDVDGTNANCIPKVYLMDGNRGFSIVELEGVKTILLGEYSLADQTPGHTQGGPKDWIRIWKSTNGGVTWSELVRWNDGKRCLRHIHTIQQNPYNKKIYIAVGDANESDQVFATITGYTSATQVSVSVGGSALRSAAAGKWRLSRTDMVGGYTQPAAAVSFSSTTALATGVTATATANAFTADDVGKVLIINADNVQDRHDSAIIIWDGVSQWQNNLRHEELNKLEGFTVLSSHDKSDVHGGQKYRASDIFFDDEFCYYSTDTDYQITYTTGLYRMRHDGSELIRINNDWGLNSKRHTPWLGTQINGKMLFTDYWSDGTNVDQDLGIWTPNPTNDIWSKSARVGMGAIAYAAPWSLFNDGELIYLSVVGNVAGQIKQGTVIFKFDDTDQYWLNDEPITLAPLFHVDGTLGVDNTDDDRGRFKDRPFATLKYALESNRVPQGANILVNDSSATSSALITVATNFATNPGQAGKAVTITGKGKANTVLSFSYTGATGSIYIPLVNNNLDFRDITLRQTSANRLIQVQAGFACNIDVIDSDLGSKTNNSQTNVIFKYAGSTILYRSRLLGPEVAGAGYLYEGNNTAGEELVLYSSVIDGGNQNANARRTFRAYNSLFINSVAWAIGSDATTYAPILENCIFWSPYNDTDFNNGVVTKTGIDNCRFQQAIDQSSYAGTPFGAIANVNPCVNAAAGNYTPNDQLFAYTTNGTGVCTVTDASHKLQVGNVVTISESGRGVDLDGLRTITAISAGVSYSFASTAISVSGNCKVDAMAAAGKPTAIKHRYDLNKAPFKTRCSIGPVQA